MSTSLLSLRSNVSSLRAQRQLAQATESLSSTFTRLSSGLRINSASDDAAGLSISQALKASTRVYSQAVRNLSDGLSYLNIGEGALRQLSAITTRQLELAEQAATGVYTLLQRRAMNTEANALADEFNRIVQSTSFNGRNILDLGRNGGDLVLQGGYGASGSLKIGIGNEFSRTVGDGTFTLSTTYQAPIEDGGGFDVVDLNGDGNVDAVTSGNDAGHAGYAIVTLGNGDGSFRAGTTYYLDVWFAEALSLADVDNDAIPDIIAGGDNLVSVMLGTGDGTFQAAITLEFGETAANLSVSDIDNNGTQDLLVAGNAGRLSAYLGNGNATFKAPTVESYGTNSAEDMVLADVNSDGLQDSLTASFDGVGIKLGNGDGTFKAEYVYQDMTVTCGISVVDIDGNGTLDLLAAGEDASGLVSVRHGDGQGQFGAATIYQMDLMRSSDVSASDANGDGIRDLVSAGYGPESSMTIRLGNGDGTFRNRLSFETFGVLYRELEMIDVNKDGVMDAVTDCEGAIGVALGNTTKATTMPRLNLLSQKDARETLDFLKNQLTRISSEMGAFGSFASRLAVASNVLQVSKENFLSANSRIEDADIAVETASLARTQIVQQAASAVLAQANQSPSLALRLLAA